MKHAGPELIAQLGSNLEPIRKISGLKEKSPGVFYRKSRACLHFHEHQGAVFADLRLEGTNFERLPVNSPLEWEALLQRLQQGES